MIETKNQDRFHFVSFDFDEMRFIRYLLFMYAKSRYFFMNMLKPTNSVTFILPKYVCVEFARIQV